MKKKLFLFIAAVTTAVSVFSQEGVIVEDNRKNTLSVGPKVGLNFSSMSNWDDVDLGLKSGIGFEAGVALNLHLGKKRGGDAGTGMFGIQVEPSYVQHSIKTDVSDDITLGYFEVPILLKVYINPELSIELGPTVCGIMSKSPDLLLADTKQIAIGDLKGFDFKGTVGLSYQTRGGFWAAARYNLGTSELAGNFPCKVSAISVSVGYLFNVFKF